MRLRDAIRRPDETDRTPLWEYANGGGESDEPDDDESDENSENDDAEGDAAVHGTSHPKAVIPDGDGVGSGAPPDEVDPDRIWRYARENRHRLIRVESRQAITLKVLIAGLLGLFVTIVGAVIVNALLFA